MTDNSGFDPISNMLSMGEMFTPQGSVRALREFLTTWPDLVDSNPPPIAACENVTLSAGDREIPARLYRPYGPEPDEAGPALIYFHGGGFMVGTLDTHDPLLRRLSAVSGARIISIDYRLAPEHPFPAGLEDAIASVDAVLTGALSDHAIDRTRLAVGGDSAGGNFAATIARERRTQIQHQLLIYPVLQLAEIEKRRARWQEGPLLSKAILKEISQSYVAEADPMDPRVSPLMAEDLAGLPSCYFLAAEMDPLFEEGEAYCAKLEASGVSVKRRTFKAAPHGFLNFTRVMPVAIKAIEECGAALREALKIET